MIQKYINDNYGSIKEIAKVITKGKHPDYEDLCHEVILRLLTGNKTKINSLIENDAIKWYIIRTAINQYRSSSSGYYKKYRKQERLTKNQNKEVKEHITFLNNLDLQITKAEKNRTEDLLKFINDKLQDVPWFERNCFEIYYWEELTLDSMSKLTGINRNTLFLAIKETRNYIQDEVRRKGIRR